MQRGYINGLFIPLSVVGLEFIEQLNHALDLGFASDFRVLMESRGDKRPIAELNELFRSESNVRSVVFSRFFPDSELSLLKSVESLKDPNSESIKRKETVKLLGSTSLLRHREPLGDFIEFLQSLKVKSPDFWPRVYERLSLPYTPYESVKNEPTENASFLAIIIGMFGLGIFWFAIGKVLSLLLD